MKVGIITNNKYRRWLRMVCNHKLRNNLNYNVMDLTLVQ